MKKHKISALLIMVIILSSCGKKNIDYISTTPQNNLTIDSTTKNPITAPTLAPEAPTKTPIKLPVTSKEEINLIHITNNLFVNVINSTSINLPNKINGYNVTWEFDNTFFKRTSNQLTLLKNGRSTLTAIIANRYYTNFEIVSENGKFIYSYQQNLKINYMFITNSKKLGNKMNPTLIVVHNTANIASAENEVKYLNSASNNSSTSYHFAVDDKEIYQAIPTNTGAYHAGNKTINEKSIGIEIAKSTSKDNAIKNKAIANGIKLIAMLQAYYDIDTKNVITHKDASGKHCPHDIIDRYTLDKFYKELKEKNKS